MTSAVISGYVALGTGFVSNQFQEVSGGSYAREALALTGSYTNGLTQALTQFSAPSAPANAPIRLGAIFDASTAGNLLMWWEWSTLPLTVVGNNFPATTINVTLYGNISAEMFASGGALDPGAMIGFVNGAPLVSATRLLIEGGNLIPQAAGTIRYENPLFTVGGVNVGRFDASGNFIIKGSLIAASTTIGSNGSITI